jgi:predicted mannosyl-3-phosphoglycerate phosphatase (HAD superfamily)
MKSMAGLHNILICSDLDRTLIPNGFQKESAHARPVFRQLAENANIYLAASWPKTPIFIWHM